MNNKIIIWVVVGVVVVGGLVWWLLGAVPSPGGGGSGPGGSLGGSQSSPTGQAGYGTATSMKALLAAGTSQKCTFTNAGANGTVYVTAGHMRGDFAAQTSGGQPVVSHMITDGTTSWIWAANSTQGMKMSFAAVDQPQKGAPQGQPTQAVSPSAPMDYSCSGWTPDQSLFTIPKGIIFSDMSALVGAAAGANAGASAGASAGTGKSSNPAMCSQCNQIPNASQKKQCLAAMGCK